MDGENRAKKERARCRNERVFRSEVHIRTIETIDFKLKRKINQEKINMFNFCDNNRDKFKKQRNLIFFIV